MRPDIVIFDLDGTLADIDHRRHLVRQKPKRWRAFFEACVFDRPNVAVITTYRAFQRSGLDYRLWIFSGRSDVVRPQTERWLAEHVGHYDHLRMRPEGDHTPDEDLKRRWVEPVRHRVLCVFDDRNKVVAMWRTLGIPCFQVAEGNF